MFLFQLDFFSPFELNENNDHDYFSFLFLGVDTKLKFTLEPSLGQNGFQQVIWFIFLRAYEGLGSLQLRFLP